ncbi:sigma 54-interacting transcriptional regulator [Virgibacillus sp. C22-A2]|uniref:HTH-type transcriptional regulatory protein TyrR n=1 Tax=Virgibacillus tibetensis TaxID=3042313 RepID=A0ABU6KD74_9BACI|nr:sigma 54-interacting transcriptional regulator [Virgibacillus sp. C22-A2]
MEEKYDNELLTEIVDHFSDEIFVTDNMGTVLLVNEVCEYNYGIPAEQLIGKNIKELEDSLFYPSATIEVLKRERPVEIMQRTTRGKRLFVKSRPIFNDEGKLLRVISYARDLTINSELQQRINLLEKQLKENDQDKQDQEFKDVIAQSESMKNVLKLTLKIARTDTTVLISGETGVGKNMMAKKIHSLSHRNQSPYKEVNCANLSNLALDMELFGSKDYGVRGIIELTNGSTLYLDEIDEMPYDMQSKLLNVLENQQLVTQGNNKVEMDIRFLVSTRKNLEELVKEGKFREDLYYRLNVIPIKVPPLRERKEDVSPLAFYFLNQLNEKYGQTVSLSPIVMNAFFEYEWAGNVREMRNLLEKLVITSDTSEIKLDQLPPNIKAGSISHAKSLPDKLEQLERYLIIESYDLYKSSYKVAESLGISQSSAIRKIKKYINQ